MSILIDIDDKPLPGGVRLVYYRYDDDVSRTHRLWWLNWLASTLTGSPFIHVEIAFSDGTIFSIAQGGSITKNFDKSYRGGRYECQLLMVTNVQEESMRRYLEEKVKFPSTFNAVGFWMLPWWPRSGVERNSFFCSELVSSAMEQAGFVFEGHPPHTISPGALHDLVEAYNYGVREKMINSDAKPLVV